MASFPPPYHTGPPSLAVSPGNATAYPVTWPGLATLNRFRTSTPAASRRAKNSSWLFADAAAVVTCRRSVTLGASSRPRRAAFSDLGAGRPAGRGAVGRGGGAQPVALLGGQARGADLVPFPGQARFAAVLPGQHGNDVDVVLAVPDRDPAHGLIVLPGRGQPGAVQHLVRDAGPLIVGQHPVLRSGPHRAVPHRPLVAPASQGGLRLQEQPGQRGEVALAVRPQRRLQRSGMPPPGDNVRVGMFLAAAGAEQVVQERFDVLPARGADLPDHFSVTAGPGARRRLLRPGARRGAACRRRNGAGPRRVARSRSASRPPGSS